MYKVKRIFRLGQIVRVKFYDKYLKGEIIEIIPCKMIVKVNTKDFKPSHHKMKDVVILRDM